MQAPAGDNDAITSINVTPLVDIILVLLIIFMVTAPLLHRRALHVNVPKAAKSERVATQALSVEFDAKGEIRLEGRRLVLQDMVHELSLAAARDPSVHVAVAADRSLPYGEVVRLLDAIRGAGVLRVGLEVKPR